MAKRIDSVKETTVTDAETVDTIKESVEETTENGKSTTDTKESDTETVNPAQEMVELFVERDSSDDNTNFIIGINGKNWLMPRGEYSTVPRFVAEEYERAKRAKNKADKAAEQMRGIKAAN